MKFLIAAILSSPCWLMAAWCRLTRRENNEVETSWIDEILDRHSGGQSTEQIFKIPVTDEEPKATE